MEEEKVLQLLMKATISQQLAWKKTDADRYEARTEHANEKIPVSIQLRQVIFAGEEFPEVGAVTITIDRFEMTFFAGTEGMEITKNILALAVPEWKEHHQLVSKRLVEASDTLSKLLCN